MQKLTPIEGCITSTAVSTEKLIENIKKTRKLGLPSAFSRNDWRVNKPIAIVGGAPSLKDTIHKLEEYQNVVVCGSAHDHVIRNGGGTVTHCVICDPDPIMGNYLTQADPSIKYYVASQCDKSIFDHLRRCSCDVFVWDAAGENFDNSVFGDTKSLCGGGCTVLTRAMFLALAFGYNTLHLFGADSCLKDDYTHHAYKFSTEEETIGDIREVVPDLPNGKKYKVAGYMLAQIFDIKQMCDMYPNRMNITVHGDSLLKDIFDYAVLKAGEAKNAN